MSPSIKVFVFIIACFSFITLAAQEKPAADTIAKPQISVTRHSIKIDGKPINYTATAGTLLLKNEKGEAIAVFGFTAYTKDGEADMTKRPITFSYNGGPGSASMWLHMGIMGPRRIVVNDPNFNAPPPYKVEDNNYSILDVSDIVMIDPVGTGYSQATGKAKNKDFWGVDQDCKSISQFIKQYVTENDRWNSPKYLLGESYGTMRSAAVVNYLQENMGMAVNGVVLVSNVLDLRTLTFKQGDDISYMFYIPSYAAVAWYHNKLANKPANLEAFLKEVRQFAAGEYAAALVKGDQLSSADKDLVIDKLNQYTGISKEYWKKAGLRVNIMQFNQELLRNEHQTVGRLDSRYKGITQNLLAESANYDPQSSAISPPFIAAFMNYYFTELKFPKNPNYKTSAGENEGFDWDWNHAKNAGWGPSPTNTAVDLAEAMAHNPNLKVLVMNGYYDLATPFFATEYTFDHMGLDPSLKANIKQAYYEAGHMMYIYEPSAKAFKKDVGEFISSTSK